MSNLAIRVNNISKLYHIGAKQQRHDTLRDSIVSALEAPKRWFGSNGHTSAEDDLWALKDVSFDVKQGEVVGRQSLRPSTIAQDAQGKQWTQRGGDEHTAHFSIFCNVCWCSVTCSDESGYFLL